MTAKEKNPGDIQDSLFKLAEELNSLIVREHQILQEEMRQVRVLVGDAVKNLDSNFRSLSSSASSQAEILNQVDKTGTVSEEQSKKLTEISDQISAQTSTTIRVLQFDDIVQQLAGHTCDRIERIQELFAELELNLGKIRQHETRDIDVVTESIKLMREEVDRFRTRLEKDNPVRQKSMAAGKIELF